MLFNSKISLRQRFPQYRGYKLEIRFVGTNIIVNANTIGRVFNSSPETFLKQPEVLKYMYDYGKYRLHPQLTRDLKDRYHYSVSRNYSQNGDLRETYYFEKNLAVRYATWLNLDFGVWLFHYIDDIISEIGYIKWENKLYY